MAPPPKNVKLDASTDTYRGYFERGLELDAEAQEVKSRVTKLNREAEHAGADSGALALARRLRKIPNLDRRRAKLRAYAQVLVEMEDEILEQERRPNGGP